MSVFELPPTGLEHIIRNNDPSRTGIQHEILTMELFNTKTREGYRFQMTVTDCYRWVYVRRPIFGGASKHVRVLDDGKVNLKLREYLGVELRNIGWV